MKEVFNCTLLSPCWVSMFTWPDKKTLEGCECLRGIPYQKSWWAYLFTQHQTQCVDTICNHQYIRLWSIVKFKPKSTRKLLTKSQENNYDVYIQINVLALKFASQNVSPIWPVYSLKQQQPKIETHERPSWHDDLLAKRQPTVQYRIV